MSQPPWSVGIKGSCPACGQQELRASRGEILCGYVDCTRPRAVTDLLETDTEIHHVVTCKASSFTLTHPLRERLDGDLTKCDMHDRVANGFLRLNAPNPHKDDRFRVTLTVQGELKWERLSGK